MFTYINVQTESLIISGSTMQNPPIIHTYFATNTAQGAEFYIWPDYYSLCLATFLSFCKIMSPLDPWVWLYDPSNKTRYDTHSHSGLLYKPAEHSERPFSTLETRSRISSFQSHASRWDREFHSLNFVLWDENENFYYQSQTSRRERESRLRQISREFSRITFIACLMTGIFQE